MDESAYYFEGDLFDMNVQPIYPVRNIYDSIQGIDRTESCDVIRTVEGITRVRALSYELGE